MLPVYVGCISGQLLGLLCDWEALAWWLLASVVVLEREEEAFAAPLTGHRGELPPEGKGAMIGD